MSTTQKCALITGGSGGIGYELAKLFAKDQYNLILVSRNQQELDNRAQELQQQFGVQVTTIAKDLSKREEAFALCEDVSNRGMQVDVFVSDAGQGQYGEFTDTDINRDIEIIDLNIVGNVILTHHFLKEMVARNDGKILQLASIASRLPGPLQSVYHATKAFVLSFSEAIREEVKDKNVTVTALLPGPTATDFFNKAEIQESKMVQEGSMSDPADVAKDGYDALMAGDDKVVSGMKNKMQVAMSNVMPDTVITSSLHKQAEPVNKDEKKQ